MKSEKFYIGARRGRHHGDQVNVDHVWKEDGFGGGHRGEYGYTCTECGARDWIASYGTVDQLGDGKPCPGRPPILLTDDELLSAFHTVIK